MGDQNSTEKDRVEQTAPESKVGPVDSNQSIPAMAEPGAQSPSSSQAGWSICTPRLFSLLEPSKTVLIAGCGGGYDFLSGLPIYYALKQKGKKVILANLSFTDLKSKTDGKTYCEMCYKISAQTKVKTSPEAYFPELYLSQWFKDRFQEDVSVYTFWRSIGVSQLSKAYQKICDDQGVDAIVLVDGGTDSLMFGFEERMGTPVEDQTSILAVDSIKSVPTKLLTCLGFGVDSFHGVSHGLFLENVAMLEKSGGYLGSFSVSQHSAEGQFYMEAYRAVAKCMQPSIVCSSITDAMSGHFGNYHSTERTGRSQLFINPLMSMYWTFDVGAVVEQIPYRKELETTKDANEVMKIIAQNHNHVISEGKIRKPIALPM